MGKIHFLWGNARHYKANFGKVPIPDSNFYKEERLQNSLTSGAM